MVKALAFQGTGSNVGKSMLVAGMCRAAVRRGLSVAPFKPQNMSNNAAVTQDGGEIGRAQALQARAAGLKAHTDMNPVLLKPESDTGSQVIVQGKRIATMRAREYGVFKAQLLGAVIESFNRLKASHDLVIVEGAGSPAEVNLRMGDIANMGFARAADVPVVLCADIDRGGVIAQLVGTHAVIDSQDNALVRGFIVNKFKGDPRLFDDGYRLIEQYTMWRGFGVLPWFSKASKLPAEDALDLGEKLYYSSGDRVKNQAIRPLHIACLRLSRIANFDDLDPLAQEPNVRLSMVQAGQTIPADADVVIIPGTKSTRADLAFLRAQGWDIDIMAHYRRGGHILGICGGYQILGQTIEDPEGIEGYAGHEYGLGLLDITTLMGGNKQLNEVNAKHFSSGQIFRGYEIHIGQSKGPARARPFAVVDGRDEGATSVDGRVCGSYLHGMFGDDGFRSAWLGSFGQVSRNDYERGVDQTLDDLADHIEAHLDVVGLLSLAR